jgi:hypothetical protein
MGDSVAPGRSGSACRDVQGVDRRELSRAGAEEARRADRDRARESGEAEDEDEDEDENENEGKDEGEESAREKESEEEVSDELWAKTSPIDEDVATQLLAPKREAWFEAEESSEIDGVIDIECWVSGPERRLYDGSIEVDELVMEPEGPSLFVAGDLTVRGVVQQGFRAGFLVVLGTLRAKSISTCAMIVVTGDLIVEDTIYGNCTNYMTNVLGKTKAKVLISAKEHYFCLYGGREVETLVDTYGDTPNMEGAQHTSDDALAMDDAYDEVEAATKLRAGQSLVVVQ